MEQSKPVRRLRRYLQADLTAGAIALAVTVIFLIMYVMSICGIAILSSTEGYDGIILMLFIITFMLSILGMTKRVKLHKQLRELSRAGEMAKVINDFEHARSMYDGKIVMGNFYTFGKRCSAVVKYEYIVRVYEYVHYTNYIRDGRQIKAKLRNGKEVELCILKVRKKRFDEEMQIIKIIQERNPSVQIGV